MCECTKKRFQKRDGGMKTEEKARELASELIGEDQNQKPMIDVIMRMANWKEQQMIDKACEWIEENIVDYEDIYYDVGGFVSPEFHIEEFIKDFKKAMEEQL